MARLKKNTSKPNIEQTSDFDFKSFYIVFGFLSLCFIGFIVFYEYSNHKHLIPISALAIIIGIVYESRRLSDNWSSILKNIFWAFLISLLAFFPGKKESEYIFETHMQIWPYIFIIIFSSVSIIFHGDKVVPRLSEGITLLQSIAVVYWFVDYGFVEMDNWFLLFIMFIGLIFILYALVHAFTYIQLSRTNRLMLSIWSSIIMMLFAVDNIIGIYQNEQIENTAELTHGLYIALQFFLLGVSCIYILQNAMMLVSFFPGKGRFFNAEYFSDVKELKNDHIKRYSEDQLHIIHSLFCLFSVGILFSLNFYYQILPRHLAIWIVFIFFPYVVALFDYLLLRNGKVIKQKIADTNSTAPRQRRSLR